MYATLHFMSLVEIAASKTMRELAMCRLTSINSKYFILAVNPTTAQPTTTSQTSKLTINSTICLRYHTNV